MILTWCAIRISAILYKQNEGLSSECGTGLLSTLISVDIYRFTFLSWSLPRNLPIKLIKLQLRKAIDNVYISLKLQVFYFFGRESCVSGNFVDRFTFLLHHLGNYFLNFQIKNVKLIPIPPHNGNISPLWSSAHYEVYHPNSPHFISSFHWNVCIPWFIFGLVYW